MYFPECQLAHGTAKLTHSRRCTSYYLSAGPAAAVSVFSGKAPHTMKKNERKKGGEKDDPSAPVPI